MILKEIIYPKIINGEKVLLMFDYDGTLTPIVDKPEFAKLDPEIKTALEIISGDIFTKVAIISGRNINVLKKLSGITIKDIFIFGLHGGECLIDGKIYDYSSKTNKDKIQKIYKILEKELKNIKGILIENKEYSVAIHYRLVEEIIIKNVLEIVYNILDLHNSNKEFRIQNGKKVVEIVPANFSKDKAVNPLLMSFPDYFPVYFGDDATDILALREVIKHKGIAVGVGNRDFIFTEEVNQVVKIEHVNSFIKNIAKEIKCL